jgi:SAM-dependent methyltransferase
MSDTEMVQTVATTSTRQDGTSPSLLAALEEVLDHAGEALRAGDDDATDRLVERLDRLVDRAGSAAARTALSMACRRHPTHALLLEDPYTRRAYDKPRGYAGDAVMLDHVYDGRVPEGTSEIGAAVFRTTTSCSTARSVVVRREVLARRLDEVADRVIAPRVVSIAAGQLREAQRARAVLEGRLGSFLAIDQDRDSLDEIARSTGPGHVTTLRESVGAILKGRVPLACIDLAYAAGLLDYLDDRTAQALVGVLAQSLSAGGRLLVANFTRGHHARGYMELVMDWVLVRRDAEDLEALVRDLPIDASIERWTDRDGNVAYLELVRRSP